MIFHQIDLEGGEPIKVVATDKDNNTSTEATTTVVDTTAPDAPTVNGVTSEATTVSGTATRQQLPYVPKWNNGNRNSHQLPKYHQMLN
ncbi:hypothetical protein AB6G37_01510 [Staphylococcus ureilyticus]|uniref:hypothetical protein n=1 Tax=Staphylococcus ureilyticus TaxID=94138 RepID=UPI0034DCD7FB